MSAQFLNLTAGDIVHRCSHFLSADERSNMIEHNVDGFFLYNYCSMRFLRHTVGLSQVSAFLVLNTFRQDLPQSIFVMLDDEGEQRNPGNRGSSAIEANINGSGDTNENRRSASNL